MPTKNRQSATGHETPTTKLRQFFNQLPDSQRDLVVSALNLQITTRPPLSESEKQSKLAAAIIKQAD
jgi:hypothetical protein